MSKGWAGGSTRQGRRVRAAVLLRDQALGYGCRAHEGGWCAAEGVGVHVCAGVGTAVHHTLGKAKTGDDPTHMVASCSACNLAIGEPGQRGDPPNEPITRWPKA